MYKKHGFIKEGELIMDRYTRGKYYNTIVMGRWLANYMQDT